MRVSHIIKTKDIIIILKNKGPFENKFQNGLSLRVGFVLFIGYGFQTPDPLRNTNSDPLILQEYLGRDLEKEKHVSGDGSSAAEIRRRRLRQHRARGKRDDLNSRPIHSGLLHLL